MTPDPNQDYPKKSNSQSDPKQENPEQERPANYTSGPPIKPPSASLPKSSSGGQGGSGLPPFLGGQFARVNDPNSGMPLYAVLKQKIVTLTDDLHKRLSDKHLPIAALDADGNIDKLLGSIHQESKDRVIKTDCPEFDDNNDPVHTILLDWLEPTDVQFPELVIVGPGDVKQLLPQANNYLVVSFDASGDPNNPPARPPVTTSQPINTQPTDFRPLAPGDEPNYKQHSGKDKGPAVAVLDTGLKFNLHNQHEEDKWPDPYVYRDANNQKRRFTLAYQGESTTNCNMADNHLGYCALQAYRQDEFIEKMKLLSNMPNIPGSYKAADVMNSPFDDCVVLIDPEGDLDMKNIKDARHGTSITAIIQQNGDNAPVLPVKAFDNLGYATLFDVLNGFNYILHRCQKSNIRVVNASWIFNRDEPLLRRKIGQLLKAGVLVIAASGNKGQTPKTNLDENRVYPACYSVEFPNVIAVTTVRETHFSPDILGPKQDDVITNLQEKVDQAGPIVTKIFDLVDDVVDLVARVRGYVAVENYSRQFVNVGVVSKRGHFRSPFHNSPDITGSSYACAFMTGFVIRQLRDNAGLLALLESGLKSNVAQVRQELLEATGKTDRNLAQEYTVGGYYLDGHATDAY
jgi:hypothetical protein